MFGGNGFESHVGISSSCSHPECGSPSGAIAVDTKPVKNLPCQSERIFAVCQRVQIPRNRRLSTVRLRWNEESCVPATRAVSIKP